jgi:hypothetical protein
MNAPVELVEAFAARLRADLEAFRASHPAELATIYTSEGMMPERWRALLDRVPGAEVVDREERDGHAWLTLRAEVAEVVAAAEVERNAAELAREAVELAELVIDAAIRGPVLAAAAAELAACWPAPPDPLWDLVSTARRFARAVPTYGRGDLDGAARRYLPALERAVSAEDRAELGAILGVDGGAFAPLFFGGALLVGRKGGRLAIPGLALAVLYRFELWRSSMTFAAGEAFASVRALAAAEHPGDAHFAAVDRALEEAADEDGDTLAADARADVARRSTFAGELMAEAGKVARRFEGKPGDEAAARATVDTPHGPALRWDAAFADVLESIRPRGPGGVRRKAAMLADDVRRKAAERTAAERAEPLPGMPRPPAGALWGLWFELDTAPGDPPRWLRVLARALWADVWRPTLARPVALTVTALGVVTGALAGRKVEAGAYGRRVLVNREGRAVAIFEGPRLATAVQAEALDALALAGVGELATVAAARFVPWFAHAVQRRPNERAPLVFEGGAGVNAYGTVAAALGMDPEKDAAMVRGLLHALNCAILAYPDGSEAGVLMLDYRPGGGRGKTSRLTLTPGRPWRSKDSGLPEDAEYRALAPIPLLPDLAPPFVGDRRDRGPLARLYLRILAELAREAPDIYLGNGARIPGARWVELARQEGVTRPPPLLVELVQDRWTRDGDDGPAVFERVGHDRWHLAPAFAAEREMLETGGMMRIGSSEGGRRSAEARARAAKRLADEATGKGRGKGRR